jgi:hypothetical protein
MRFAFAFLTACQLTAAPVMAESYCTEFLSPDSMPQRYQRLAPIYSSTETGWIFADNQFTVNYDIKPEAMSLLQDITQIFADNGLPFAVLMPPPRPLIAGTSVLTETAGAGLDFNPELAAASYSRMVQMVNRTGIIMPDLLSIVRDDPRLQSAYYFQRDTHWTPIGAAASAIIMSRAVAQRDANLFPDAGSVRPALDDGAETLEEIGSLSKVAKDVCGNNPAPELVRVPYFPSSADALFGDETAKPNIALLGTSYSNRRRRDFYRVADAIAGAFQANVDNYSVSGGGMISTVEVFAQHVGFKESAHDLVIWEIPYNEGFGSVSALRQILGALQLETAEPIGEKQDLDTSGHVSLPYLEAGNLLVLKTPNGVPESVSIELTFANGRTSTIRFKRKGHFPPEWQLSQAAISLANQPKGQIVGIAVVYDPETTGAGATVELASAN